MNAFRAPIIPEVIPCVRSPWRRLFLKIPTIGRRERLTASSWLYRTWSWLSLCHRWGNVCVQQCLLARTDGPVLCRPKRRWKCLENRCGSSPVWSTTIWNVSIQHLGHLSILRSTHTVTTSFERKTQIFQLGTNERSVYGLLCSLYATTQAPTIRLRRF